MSFGTSNRHRQPGARDPQRPSARRTSISGLCKIQIRIRIWARGRGGQTDDRRHTCLSLVGYLVRDRRFGGSNPLSRSELINKIGLRIVPGPSLANGSGRTTPFQWCVSESKLRCSLKNRDGAALPRLPVGEDCTEREECHEDHGQGREGFSVRVSRLLGDQKLVAGYYPSDAWSRNVNSNRQE